MPTNQIIDASHMSSHERPLVEILSNHLVVAQNAQLILMEVKQVQTQMMIKLI